MLSLETVPRPCQARLESDEDGGSDDVEDDVQGERVEEVGEGADAFLLRKGGVG